MRFFLKSLICVLIAAWQCLFEHFNQKKANGQLGYRPGQKITIKANLVTSNRLFKNVDVQGNQTAMLGWVNTSPQMIVALLDQLVNVVGVDPRDITVGDPTCHFPNHYWDHCHSRFPDVHYLSCGHEPGRLTTLSSEGLPCESPFLWTPDVGMRTLRDVLLPPVPWASI